MFCLSEVFDNEGKPVRGYRKRMFKIWQDLGGFEITEQRLCDQARAIRKNGWLSDLELEAIRREISNETQDEHDMEEGVTTEGVLQDQHLRQANDIEVEHVENEHTLSDVDLNEKEKVIMNEIRALYTTFTDRAPEDWAEIWGERNFVLYTNTYEYGWLIVTIVGYSVCLSSFSFVICYYLLICDLAALGRVFSLNYCEYFRFHSSQK